MINFKNCLWLLDNEEMAEVRESILIYDEITVKTEKKKEISANRKISSLVTETRNTLLRKQNKELRDFLNKIETHKLNLNKNNRYNGNNKNVIIINGIKINTTKDIAEQLRQC